MTDPVPFVFSSLEVIDEIAREEEVALVEVELSAVKFCRVDDPVTKAFERVESPPVAVKVVPTPSEPVKLATADIVWELINPEVIVFDPRLRAPEEVIAPVVKVLAPLLSPPDRVRAPPFAVVKNRLVELAVVANMFVVVALVEVELSAVKFCRVLDAVARRLAVVVKPETVRFPRVPIEVREERVATELSM